MKNLTLSLGWTSNIFYACKILRQLSKILMLQKLIIAFYSI